MEDRPGERQRRDRAPPRPASVRAHRTSLEAVPADRHHRIHFALRQEP
jgi:hypothetical protein